MTPEEQKAQIAAAYRWWRDHRQNGPYNDGEGFEAGWGASYAQRLEGAGAEVKRLLIEGAANSLEWNAKVEDLEAERDALQKEVSRWRQDAGLKAPVGWGLDALLDGQTLLREFAEAEVGRLREEITSCSNHHAQSWQLPDWAQTKADIDAATDAQLNDTMPTCHMEDGDDECLACYAYGVICGRETESKANDKRS